MNKLTKTFLITILLIVLCFSGTSFANASTNDNTNARLAHTNMANFYSLPLMPKGKLLCNMQVTVTASREQTLQ